MGWHMVMDASGANIGCYIWDENHSFEMIRKSKECVFNIPTTDIAEKVVGIGNSSGKEIDKFQEFGLTPLKAEKVSAPLIKECFANFECRLIEESLIKKYKFFIFEVVKANVAKRPKYPETLHYRGDGLFMISGPTVSRYRKLFDPAMLDE